MDQQFCDRRRFVRKSAFLAGTTVLAPGVRFHVNSASVLSDQVLGHGEFRYRAAIGWGRLDPACTPVTNCLEMVMDSRDRLIMVGDEPRNNI